MKGRPKVKLHGSLEQRLTMYALAASAGGIGLHSFSQPASAKVIYSKEQIHLQANVPLPIDLNRDGNTDLTLVFYQNSYGFGVLYAEPEAGNQVVGYCLGLSQGCWASALRFGVRVGPNQRLGPYHYMANGRGCTRTSSYGKTVCYSFGPWGNTQKRYLGIEFQIAGKPHYGWARINVDLNHSHVVLTGYAYETIAKKSLITGKTKGPDAITLERGSLGHLARGTSSIRQPAR